MGDPTDYLQLISVAENAGKFEEVVRFLRMARSKVKDQQIDNGLVYALAKTGALGDLEEFVAGTTLANVQLVGDRLFNEELYEAAKILFSPSSASGPGNQAKLASCFVRLEQYSEAVEAAKKANNPKVWRDVNLACVAAQEFTCAATAGLQIIIHPDHLEELIMAYEKHGYHEELIRLLDQGLSQERAHVGMFTELCVLYSKYKPEKVLDFVKLNTAKVNIPKVIRACERDGHWEAAVYLYISYDEYDSAASCMMQHSPVAWSNDQFLMVIQKTANSELLYRAISFYLEEQPEKLEALMKAIESKVDHQRVVVQLRQCGHLALAEPYLKSAQTHNLPAVNEAYNELLLEKEDFVGLRKSLESYDAFDQLAMAQKLEAHELQEMRRIAALLYKKNKKYRQALELSQRDGLFKDCIETARDSGSADLALELLKSFIASKDSEAFTAMLYTCYALLKPDVVLELAWRHNMMSAAMPFMIQSVRQYTSRIDGLDKKVEDTEKEKEKQKSANNDYVPEGMPGMMGGPAGFGHLAIGNAPHMGGPPMGGGMGGAPMGGPMGGMRM